MNGAYYNEIDPYAAQWLRNLISAGHIVPGDVDERSVVEVKPDDLRGYTQCHFFAGIGGWSHALRLAGWPDDRPVWTASLPCQPFSAAGKRQSHTDERHLAPVWLRLLEECRPAIAFGEQVEPAIGFGWLDAVFIRLEQADYACGSAVFPACSVGAPHRRSRIYWCADSSYQRSPRAGGGTQSEGAQQQSCDGMGEESPTDGTGVMGDAIDAGPQGQQRPADMELHRGPGANGSTPTAGFWRDAIWLPCRDGKARPTEPGTFPLAHGATQRVGRLRAYGNAIVAPQAAEFIKACLDVAP